MMYITVHVLKGTKTEEIEKQFSLYYPYLKLEFYEKSFKEQQAVSGRTNKILLTQINEDCTINISSNRTVAEVESECARSGFHAKILRRAGNSWIETTLTNDGTLQHQNYKGEQISAKIEKEELNA